MKKRFFILIMAILVCISFTGCIVREVKTEVTATVTETYYKASYIQPYPTIINKRVTLQNRIVPAVYQVTITYDDISETFNKKDLYDSVKEGDEINVILYKGYDKDDKLIRETLLLIED